MRSILTALQEGRLFELPEAGKARALEFLARILDANPDIEVGTDTVKVVARVAEPTEREVIWERQKERSPQFAQYEDQAAPRKIPVVVLDPVK